MADPRQLTRLMREVRRAGSPVHRMKVLARAWRTLQRLSPNERASLASEVGIDGAEEIVERMASRYGRLKPAVILQALEKARSAPPGQLKELFSGLRDPRRRREILKLGLAAASAKLVDDPSGPEPGTPASKPETVAAQPGDTAQPKPARAPEREQPQKTVSLSPTPVGSAGAATVAGAAAAARARVARQPATDRAAPEATSPSAKAAPAHGATPSKPQPPRVHRMGPMPQPPRPPARAPARPPVRTAPTAPETRPTPPPLPPRVETPAQQAKKADDLMARIAEAAGVIPRLRALRAGALQARGMDVEALGRLLDLFPHRWSRRRALVALLERQVPDNLGDALALIDALESSGARRFCTGAILDKWPLSDLVRDQLLARRKRSYGTRGTPDLEAV